MKSLQIVPVLGLVLVLLSHCASADRHSQRERQLNIFHHTQPRTNQNNNRTNRKGKNNRKNNRNVPIRPRGPEVGRAMRRHFKFPILKRAQNDLDSVKGIGSRFKDAVKTGQEQSNKEKNKTVARPKRDSETIDQLQQQQDQHAPEFTSIMDVVSTFVPPSTVDVESSSTTTSSVQKIRKAPKAIGAVIAVIGVMALSIVAIRRRRFGKEDISTTINVPIRMVDENGEPVDLETSYGFGGGESLGSRSSTSRGYMGYHL